MERQLKVKWEVNKFLKEVGKNSGENRVMERHSMNYHLIQQPLYWIYIQRKGNQYVEEASALVSLMQHYAQ